MRLPIALVGALLLAGCVDDSSQPESAPEGPAEQQESSTMEIESAPTVLESVVSINWSGQLTRGGWACNVQAGCQSVPDDGAYSTDSAHELPLGNLSGGGLRLEWEAVSDITRELVVGYRFASPDCEECPRIAAETGGTSPIEVDIPETIDINTPSTLHLWVYSAMVQGEDNSGTYTGLSDEQPFDLSYEGILTHEGEP